MTSSRVWDGWNMRTFKCERGGHCCTNQLRGRAADGREFGLYLTPEEATFFPRDTIFPLLRVGARVFAYQLGVDRCPRLGFVDGLATCAIYDHRPLVCQAFPATVADDGSVRIHLDACPCTSAYATEEWDRSSFAGCVRAAKEELKQAETNPQATAMFALDTKTWIPL